jgi:hypothetical protein
MKLAGPLLALLVTVLSSRALAHDAAQNLDAPRAPEPRTRFSVGAGLGFASDSLGGDGLAGLAGLNNYYYSRGSIPFGTALLEAKLSDGLRLGLGLSGGYSKASQNVSDPSSVSSLPESSGWLGGTLNARWVLNPHDLVQVSPMVGVGGSYAKANDQRGTYVPSMEVGAQGSYLKADSSGKSVDARLGLVVEYRLLPQLYLRLESYFARLSYTKYKVADKPEGAGNYERLSQTTFSVGWLPVIQLRVAF